MSDLHSSSSRLGSLTSSPGENYILDHTSGRREGGGLNYAKVKSPVCLASKHRVTMHSSAGCAPHQGTTSKRALPTYRTADIYPNSFWADNSEGLHFNTISILHQFQTDGTFPYLHKGVTVQTHHPRSLLSTSYEFSFHLRFLLPESRL